MAMSDGTPQVHWSRAGSTADLRDRTRLPVRRGADRPDATAPRPRRDPPRPRLGADRRELRSVESESGRTAWSTRSATSHRMHRCSRRAGRCHAP